MPTKLNTRSTTKVLFLLRFIVYTIVGLFNFFVISSFWSGFGFSVTEPTVLTFEFNENTLFTSLFIFLVALFLGMAIGNKWAVWVTCWTTLWLFVSNSILLIQGWKTAGDYNVKLIVMTTGLALLLLATGSVSGIILRTFLRHRIKLN